MEIKSLHYKRTILKANIIAIPLLVFFYWRHNEFCEPYVYTLFCLTEYAIVLMNVAYHFSSYYLLYGISVQIPCDRRLANDAVNFSLNGKEHKKKIFTEAV